VEEDDGSPEAEDGSPEADEGSSKEEDSAVFWEEEGSTAFSEELLLFCVATEDDERFGPFSSLSLEQEKTNAMLISAARRTSFSLLIRIP